MSEPVWAPLCMDDVEWRLWKDADVKSLHPVYRPCAECPLSFAAEMRAIARCNGSPGALPKRRSLLPATQKERARRAPGSVRPTVGGRGRRKPTEPRIAIEQKSRVERLAGSAASANRLGTARSDRESALTAEGSARSSIRVELPTPALRHHISARLFGLDRWPPDAVRWIELQVSLGVK